MLVAFVDEPDERARPICHERSVVEEPQINKGRFGPPASGKLPTKAPYMLINGFARFVEVKVPVNWGNSEQRCHAWPLCWIKIPYSRTLPALGKQYGDIVPVVEGHTISSTEAPPRSIFVQLIGESRCS